MGGFHTLVVLFCIGHVYLWLSCLVSGHVYQYVMLVCSLLIVNCAGLLVFAPLPVFCVIEIGHRLSVAPQLRQGKEMPFRHKWPNSPLKSPYTAYQSQIGLPPVTLTRKIC